MESLLQYYMVHVDMNEGGGTDGKGSLGRICTSPMIVSEN